MKELVKYIFFFQRSFLTVFKTSGHICSIEAPQKMVFKDKNIIVWMHQRVEVEYVAHLRGESKTTGCKNSTRAADVLEHGKGVSGISKQR